MFGSERRARERLKERGQRAWATVLEIETEGKAVTTDDGQAATMLKARLRVEPADGFPFFFEDKLAFPQLGVPAVGARIAVMYDPKDHDTVALDVSGAAPAAAPAPAAPAQPPASAAAAMEMSFEAPHNLGDLMKMVKDARAVAGGDPMALAAELQRKFAETGYPAVWAGAMATPAPEDPLDRLEKLADLRAKGVLTEEEFQAQKARILGSE